MKNPLIPISIIIAGALIAGSIIFTNTSKPKTIAGGDKTNVELREVDDNDHILGNPDADIVLVEYSDFQCPYCKDFHEVMNKVMETYGKDGKVAWVYRHHPLDDYYGAPRNLHPEARNTAVASECAAELGGNDAFWKFSDAMFANQASLGEALYVSQAATLGIDEAEFKSCLADEEMFERVLEDEQGGKLQFGTPYNILISGDKAVPVNGYLPYENLTQVIDGILAE